MDYNWMIQDNYRTETLKMIDKMQEKIKIEEEKRNDCNLNINIYTDYLIQQIHSLYIDISPKILYTLWCGFHKDEKEDEDRYEVCYNIVKEIIIDDIINDMKCDYNKKNFISDIIVCGYESYAYNISFIVNNIEFIFMVPCVDKINDKNLKYANYGQYVLAYKETSCCTSYICTSYDMEDLAKAFKKFIKERNNNNASLA